MRAGRLRSEPAEVRATRTTRRSSLPTALGFTPQPMVRWLGPRGLSATAMQVLLSTIFGAYSDKRDIQAALKQPAESDFSGHDAMWFDFLADTGDGFNPTFTTAIAGRPRPARARRTTARRS